jgi:hypothetical protein
MKRVIEQFFDYFSRVTGIMMEQRILGALAIMALFAILAILVDFFIHRIVNYICKKSKVEIDNTFIGSIHRPAWIIAIFKEFKKKNISIPFPQRDVYMHPLQTDMVGPSKEV